MFLYGSIFLQRLQLGFTQAGTSFTLNFLIVLTAGFMSGVLLALALKMALSKEK